MVSGLNSFQYNRNIIYLQYNILIVKIPLFQVNNPTNIHIQISEFR
jgi:hypothetical protein